MKIHLWKDIGKDSAMHKNHNSTCCRFELYALKCYFIECWPCYDFFLKITSGESIFYIY